MASAEKGTFGELIYPKAKRELQVETMVRYRTADEFKRVAKFYQDAYGDTKYMIVTQGEEAGSPNLCVAAGPRCTEGAFSVLMVMADPQAQKQGKNDLWILVLGKD